MRQQNKLIMGIGHRIKSLSNPDMRVTIIKEYALKHFKNNKVLDFAMAVEQVGRVDFLVTPMSTRGKNAGKHKLGLRLLLVDPTTW